MLYLMLIAIRLIVGNASPEFDPALALAQAWEESCFDPSAVSRLVEGRREVGPWDKPFPANWRGPYFCGLWQVETYTESACRKVQAFSVSFVQRVHELRAWLLWCRGGVSCALAGYGCGIAGAQHPAMCGAAPNVAPYHERVLRRAARYRRGDLR